MSELGSAGVATSLQRRYETRGESPVFGMATELFPMVPASDDQMDPELHFHAGSRLCFGPAIDAALAANFSHILLTNFSPDAIAVVHEVWIRNDTPGPIGVVVGTGGAPLATVDTGAAGHVRDSRYGFAARTLLNTQNRTQAGAIAVGGSFQVNILGDSQVVLRMPWVLGPQSQLILRPTVQNLGLAAVFFWRERRIEQGELINTR